MFWFTFVSIHVDHPVPNLQPLPQNCHGSGGKPIGFENSFTAFLIWALGIVMVMILLIFDIMYYKYYYKPTPKHQSAIIHISRNNVEPPPETNYYVCSKCQEKITPIIF